MEGIGHRGQGSVDLRRRGRRVPEDQARRLVVRGFFHEIINRIAVPEVRERLEAAVEAELAAVGA